MATIAFLVSGDAELALGPTVADQLSRLGVTSIALFRDQDTLCVVLDGWAFVGTASTDAAVAAIGFGAPFRTLRPVMQTALRAEQTKEL